jgi:uncharacterized protein
MISNESQNAGIPWTERLLSLQAGAKIDLQDKFGNTPFWRAVMNSKGRGDIIRLLLKSGASRDIKNKNGKSPYDVAVLIANYDIKQYFTEAL